MAYVSKYFKPQEFACKCGCGTKDVKEELLVVLDDVREHFGVPVVITSGHRCAKHNAAVGGAKESQHVLGTAADIKVSGVAPKKVQEYLLKKYPSKYGIGVYPSWVHIDVRPTAARW